MISPRAALVISDLEDAQNKIEAAVKILAGAYRNPDGRNRDAGIAAALVALGMPDPRGAWLPPSHEDD